MKRKIIFLLVLSALANSSFAETTTADTDEVVIDLNSNTMTSDKGVVVSNGTMSGLFYKLERNPVTEEISFSDNATININQSSGNVKIETEKGKVSQKDERGEFYNSFAYMNVAKTTGAEAPNDKIYFGSPYIKYENQKIFVRDGWLTTDFKIVNYSNDPKKAGYHLFSKNILIEPDKQITLKNSDLFIKSKDVMPFNFPWFRANIRSGSRVPLFVTLQTSDDYGSATSMGVLYGNKDDKFRGGFAPKFADKMGLLIGKWENWYRFDNAGETRVNIDDLLVYNKNKKKEVANEEIPSYEKRHKRYKVEVTHDYDGENGDFHFVSQNSTRSMVGSLSDVMDKFDNNNLYKTKKIDRYKFDNNIGFYQLNTNLHNLGEAKDLSFTGKMNMVSDKKAYGLLVYDDMDDIAFGSSIDHDLYTNLALTKDNSKFKLTGSYDYLYDLDPGSTHNDLMSRNERIKAGLTLKENNAGISYDKRRGDDYRNVSFWEEDPNTSLKQRNVLGIDMNYTPTTVAKYEFNNFENINASLGDYKFGNYVFTPKLSYNYLNRKLDTTRDTYRKIVLNDERIPEYNRFENIVYQNNLERRADLNLGNVNEKYRVALGKTDAKTWTRDGLFDGTYKKYENQSKFYEIELGRHNLALGNIGTLGVDGTFRQDKFDASEDRTNSVNIKLNNDLFLYKSADLNVTNKFRIEGQKYNFSGKKENEERRLITKSDYIKVDNSIVVDGEKTQTTYDVGYQKSKNPYGEKNKNGEQFTTGVKVKLDQDTSISAKYKEDKRFTTETVDKKNFNDLTNRDYSVNLETKKYDLGYSNSDINFKAQDFKTTKDFDEKINEHRIRAGYKFDNSKLTFSYAEGTDKLNTADSKRYLDRKNREFSGSYNTYGDIEQDFYASYKTYRYGQVREVDDLRNTDVFKLTYAFRDKRFEQEQLMKYATLEYVKPEDQITAEDINQIRNILDRQRSFYQDFGLSRISDETFRIGNYKKTFNTYVTLEKNNKRYTQTGNLKDSLAKFEGGLTYSYNRVGLGYKFIEKSSWKRNSGSYVWAKDSREHELSAFAKVGKPSEGWKVKTYAMFYDNLNNPDRTRNRKKSLDSLGIEIGKEMGFYEWAVSYENRYKSSSKDYEWRAGIHFTLLTFPNNSLFGVGGKNASGNATTRPDWYFLDRPSQLKNKY